MPIDRSQVLIIEQKNRQNLPYYILLLLIFLSCEHKLYLSSGYTQFSYKKISTNGIKGWLISTRIRNIYPYRWVSLIPDIDF